MAFDLMSLLQGASSWASSMFSGRASGQTDAGTDVSAAGSVGAGAGSGYDPSGILGGMVGGLGGAMDWKGAGFGAIGDLEVSKGDDYAGGYLGGGLGGGFSTWKESKGGYNESGASAAAKADAPVGFEAGTDELAGSASTDFYRSLEGSGYTYEKGDDKGVGFDGSYTPFGASDSKASFDSEYGSAKGSADDAYVGRDSLSGKFGEKDGTYYGDVTGSEKTGVKGVKGDVDTDYGSAYAKAGELSDGTTVTGGASYDEKTGAAEAHGGGSTGMYGKDLGYGFESADGKDSYRGGAGEVKYGYEADGKIGWDPDKQEVVVDGGGRGGGVHVSDAYSQGNLDGVGKYDAKLGEFSNDVQVKDVHAEFGADQSKISVGTLDGGGMRFNDADVKGQLGEGPNAVKGDAGFGNVGSTNSVNGAFLQANYGDLNDPSLKAGFDKLSYGGWSGSDLHAHAQGPGDSEVGAKLGSFGNGLNAQGGELDIDKNGFAAKAKDIQYDDLDLKGGDLDAKLGDLASMKAHFGEIGLDHTHVTDAAAGYNADKGLYAKAGTAEYDTVHLEKVGYDAQVGDYMKSHVSLGEGDFDSFSGKNIDVGANADGAHASLEDGKYRYLGGKDIDLSQSYAGGALGYGGKADEASLGGVDIGKLNYQTDFENSKIDLENAGASAFKSKNIDVNANVGDLGADVGAKTLNVGDLNVGKASADIHDYGLDGKAAVEDANLDLLNIKGGHAGLDWDGKEALGIAGDYRSGGGVSKAQGEWDLSKGTADGSFKDANYGAQLSNADIDLFGTKIALPDAGFKMNASGGGDVDLSQGAADANLSLAGSSVNFAGHELTVPDWAQAAAGVNLSEGAANMNLGGENGVGVDVNLAEGQFNLNIGGNKIDVVEAASEAVDTVSDMAGGAVDAVADAGGAAMNFIGSFF